MSIKEDQWEGAECARIVSVAGFNLPVHEPDFWFEPYWESNAKAVCAICPIKQKCLQYSIAEKITDGVWGGLSASERRQLTTNRKG